MLNVQCSTFEILHSTVFNNSPPPPSSALPAPPLPPPTDPPPIWSLVVRHSLVIGHWTFRAARPRYNIFATINVTSSVRAVSPAYLLISHNNRCATASALSPPCENDSINRCFPYGSL